MLIAMFPVVHSLRHTSTENTLPLASLPIAPQNTPEHPATPRQQHPYLFTLFLFGFSTLLHGTVEPIIQCPFQPICPTMPLIRQRLHLRHQIQAHWGPVLVLWVGLGEEAQLFKVTVGQQKTLLGTPLGDELLVAFACVAQGDSKRRVPLVIEGWGRARATPAAVLHN